MDMEETKAIVLFYEDSKLVGERLLFRGLMSELTTLIGSESVLRESHGVFKLPIDGVNTEMRIEKATSDYEGSDKVKYICYQVVPNK